MAAITVAEILKLHGDWIDSTSLVSFVSKKMRISERMAYIKIKKAATRHEILRNLLENRTVIYGLPEFGPPTLQKHDDKDRVSADFYNSLIFQFWKVREEALRLRSAGKPFTAWDMTQRFAETLPSSPGKEQLVAFIKDINETLSKTREVPDPTPWGKGSSMSVPFFDEGQQRTILGNAVPQAWEKIAAIFNKP